MLTVSMVFLYTTLALKLALAVAITCEFIW